MPLTLPTMTPRSLTSAPVVSDPPMSSMSADTVTESENTPLPTASRPTPTTTSTMSSTRPRHTSVLRSSRSGSMRRASIMEPSPRDPYAGVAAPEQQRHDHVEQDDHDDARADGPARRLADTLGSAT